MKFDDVSVINIWDNLDEDELHKIAERLYKLYISKVINTMPATLRNNRKFINDCADVIDEYVYVIGLPDMEELEVPECIKQIKDNLLRCLRPLTISGFKKLYKPIDYIKAAEFERALKNLDYDWFTDNTPGGDVWVHIVKNVGVWVLDWLAE